MSSEVGRLRAVAADYAWVDAEAESDGLFSAYCLTLVRGITPRQFMNQIGARINFDALPLGEQFFEVSFEYWG